MITIYKNSNGDSRSAKQEVTLKEFEQSNDMHKLDVKNVMNELALIIQVKGLNHDYTKKNRRTIIL